MIFYKFLPTKKVSNFPFLVAYILSIIFIPINIHFICKIYNEPINIRILLIAFGLDIIEYFIFSIIFYFICITLWFFYCEAFFKKVKQVKDQYNDFNEKLLETVKEHINKSYIYLIEIHKDFILVKEENAFKYYYDRNITPIEMVILCDKITKDYKNFDINYKYNKEQYIELERTI